MRPFRSQGLGHRLSATEPARDALYAFSITISPFLAIASRHFLCATGRSPPAVSAITNSLLDAALIAPLAFARVAGSAGIPLGFAGAAFNYAFTLRRAVLEHRKTVSLAAPPCNNTRRDMIQN